jgi:hypothetical protein
MTRTRAAVRRHNNLVFWVLTLLMLWYASPLFMGREGGTTSAVEVRK